MNEITGQSKNGRFYNCSEIKTFRELMDWITYDWSFDPENLIKGDGYYAINKTMIEPDCLTYKTECCKISEDVYKKLEMFYDLLEN